MTNSRRFMSRAAMVALLCAGLPAALSAPARAGGDELYGDAGPPPQFIGIVRDVKSFKPIVGARVTANLKNTRASVITHSDDEGRFRIGGFADGFDSNAVEIACVKAGYKPVNILRRKLSSDPDAPVEVECLSEPG